MNSFINKLLLTILSFFVLTDFVLLFLFLTNKPLFGLINEKKFISKDQNFIFKNGEIKSSIGKTADGEIIHVSLQGKVLSSWKYDKKTNNYILPVVFSIPKKQIRVDLIIPEDNPPNSVLLARNGIIPDDIKWDSFSTKKIFSYLKKSAPIIVELPYKNGTLDNLVMRKKCNNKCQWEIENIKEDINKIRFLVEPLNNDKNIKIGSVVSLVIYYK